MKNWIKDQKGNYVNIDRMDRIDLSEDGFGQFHVDCERKNGRSYTIFSLWTFATKEEAEDFMTKIMGY